MCYIRVWLFFCYFQKLPFYSAFSFMFKFIVDFSKEFFFLLLEYNMNTQWLVDFLVSIIKLKILKSHQTLFRNSCLFRFCYNFFFSAIFWFRYGIYCSKTYFKFIIYLNKNVPYIFSRLIELMIFIYCFQFSFLWLHTCI